MKLISRRLLIILLLLLLPVSAPAQGMDPLDALLASLPASAFEEGFVSYADHAALLAARPGAKPPQNPEDAADYFKSDEGRPYLQMVMGISAGYASLRQYLLYAGEMVRVSGVNPFFLGQTLEAGFPPRQQVWLQGGLEPEAIRAALAAQGYVRLAGGSGDMELWCEDGNCENGARTDLSRRDPAFIFGGDLGRRWPLMLMEDRLAAAPDPEVFRTLSQSADPGLAGIPQVAVLLEAARAAAGQERLSQLILLKGERLPLQPRTGPLPEILAIAQADTPEGLLVIISMVYSGAEEAAAARTVLASSAADALLRNGQALMDVVKRYSGSLDPLADPTEKAALSLVFRFPPQSQTAPEAASALPFHAFSNMAYTNDLAWLAP